MKLFLGNLPPKISSAQVVQFIKNQTGAGGLASLLSGKLEIKDCEVFLCADATSGQSYSYAVVTLPTKKQFERVVAKLNNKKLGGRRVEAREFFNRLAVREFGRSEIQNRRRAKSVKWDEQESKDRLSTAKYTTDKSNQAQYLAGKGPRFSH